MIYSLQINFRDQRTESINERLLKVESILVFGTLREEALPTFLGFENRGASTRRVSTCLEIIAAKFVSFVEALLAKEATEK